MRGRLHEDCVSDILKRVAARIGMPAKQVRHVSGHSIWVGATQDLLALNIDLASVMQAGRWKSARMPMRYGEEVLAALGVWLELQKRRGGMRCDLRRPSMTYRIASCRCKAERCFFESSCAFLRSMHEFSPFKEGRKCTA